jgi:hypothetical protein
MSGINGVMWNGEGRKGGRFADAGFKESVDKTFTIREQRTFQYSRPRSTLTYKPGGRAHDDGAMRTVVPGFRRQLSEWGKSQANEGHESGLSGS